MNTKESDIKVYIVSGVLYTWDSEGGYYNTSIDIPIACRTMKDARKIANIKFDITNRANCNSSMKVSRKFMSEDKRLRTTYYEDKERAYKFEVSISEQTI